MNMGLIVGRVILRANRVRSHIADRYSVCQRVPIATFRLDMVH
jgi:hypothetical protein